MHALYAYILYTRAISVFAWREKEGGREINLFYFVLQVFLFLHLIVGIFQGVQGPVRYSLCAELFPIKGRGAAMMLTLGMGWPGGALIATATNRFVRGTTIPFLAPI